VIYGMSSDGIARNSHSCAMSSAVLSAVTFIFVLWTIGGALSFKLAGATITIPGFLVIAAVVYAPLASGTMVLVGRPLRYRVGN
jgi:ABC-type uncharacterized transport system fused permease/ATPase subunit